MGAFTQALVSFAPQIRFLIIAHALEISDISAINHLSCLRVLKINRLANVQRTADIFLFLKALAKLEELLLVIGGFVETWSPAQRPLLQQTPDRTTLPTGIHLKTLQSLCIRGPSQIVAEFLDFLGSPNLTSLSLTSTGWLHVKRPAQLHNEPFDVSERDQPSDQQPAELGSRSCTAACTSSHRHEWILTRWSKTLESLTISSCDRTTFDLSSISKHEALKNLDIEGGATPITELFSSGVPTCHRLQTLDLSLPDSNLTLFELGKIALLSPNLLRLSSSFYIGSESELDSLAEIATRSHQLEVLTMNRAILKDVGSSTLHHASKIALHLHLMFPKLKEFNHPPGNESESKFWEDVWYIVQLLKNVAQYAKRPNVSEAGVMTEQWS
jgi:hypothetical protein